MHFLSEEDAARAPGPKVLPHGAPHWSIRKTVVPCGNPVDNVQPKNLAFIGLLALDSESHYFPESHVASHVTFRKSATGHVTRRVTSKEVTGLSKMSGDGQWLQGDVGPSFTLILC